MSPMYYVDRAHASRGDEGRGEPRPLAISAVAPDAKKRLLERCALCGNDLPGASRRKVCDRCLPTSDRLRTEKLRAAGQDALLRMRSHDDPAQRLAAQEKRIASSRERMLAIRAWERLNGKVHDWERYEVEVIPVITA